MQKNCNCTLLADIRNHSKSRSCYDALQRMRLVATRCQKNALDGPIPTRKWNIDSNPFKFCSWYNLIQINSSYPISTGYTNCCYQIVITRCYQSYRFRVILLVACSGQTLFWESNLPLRRCDSVMPNWDFLCHSPVCWYLPDWSRFFQTTPPA